MSFNYVLKIHVEKYAVFQSKATFWLVRIYNLCLCYAYNFG